MCYSFKCTSVFMSNQIFLLSDQNGALVGHMSFQGKKKFSQPCPLFLGMVMYDNEFETKGNKILNQGQN